MISFCGSLWVYTADIQKYGEIDERFGYAGVIVAKINAEIDTRTSSFLILSDYTDKPTISNHSLSIETLGQRIFGFIYVILAFFLFIHAIVEPKNFASLFTDIRYGDWEYVFTDYALTYLIIFLILSTGVTFFWKELFPKISKI